MKSRIGEVPWVLDVTAIKERIPHRYPFLFLDRVLDWEPGKRAVGVKCVTINEPFFNGHFPHMPIVPGVIILEAMAQLAGVALGEHLSSDGSLPLFGGIDKARFRRVVRPGDQLQLEVEVLHVRRGTARVAGKAWVDDEMAAEAGLLFVAGAPDDIRDTTGHGA